MAVEDVNNPKTVTKVDPRAVAEKGEGNVAYWTRKADEARARRDYLAEEEAMKMLGKTPEPAFQVKGTVNLGDINPQQAAREAQERADKAMESKDKDIREANKKAAEAENKLHQEKLEGIRQDFTHQMDGLKQIIEKMATAKDARPLHEQFKEQYTTVLGLAKDLGLEKTSTGRDPMVDIKLAEMSYENAMRDREFQLQMRENDRKWELDLQRLQDERAARQAELAIQAKRNDLLFQAPQVIGAALAKGMAESASGGGGGIPAGGGAQSRPGVPQHYKMRAAEGESGVVDCPLCNAKVGIGPNSDLAQCVACNATFDIERVPATETPTPVAAEEEAE